MLLRIKRELASFKEDLGLAGMIGFVLCVLSCCLLINEFAKLEILLSYAR